MRRGPLDPHRILWPEKKPVVGVIHLLPLPGSPRWGGSIADVSEEALRDARLLQEGGVDGLLVENFKDAPFYPGAVPSETVAAMTVVVRSVVESSSLPVGVNLLRNDAGGALSVAAATGAGFIRVNIHTGSMFTDQGLLQGRAHETLRKRTALGVPIAILADVLVKHATPPPGTTLSGAARDSWHRGLADGLILTGAETGSPVPLDELRRVREALPEEAPVWVGSGATPDTAAVLLEEADGIIVGSALQIGGRAGGGVEASRVKAFMEALDRSPEGPSRMEALHR
jgi:membrane complex biogenesis BtpA family protein